MQTPEAHHEHTGVQAQMIDTAHPNPVSSSPQTNDTAAPRSARSLRLRRHQLPTEAEESPQRHAPFPAPAWLNTLVQQSLGDFELTPDLDRVLSTRALQAQTDRAARDELLTMLAYKVARFHLRALRRARAFSGVQPDADDLAQEAWLVFVEVLTGWKPLPGPVPRGFSFYFLRVFPLRLQDRVTAAQRAARMTTSSVPLDLVVDEELGPLRNDLELDVQTALLLQEIAARIDPADLRLVLVHRARPHGSPHPSCDSGMSRRTYYRRLAHITSRLRHLT